MPNYSNGKIYVLRTPSGLQYVGSTTQKLCSRKAGHKQDYNKWKNGKREYISSFKLYEEGDVVIVLLEEFPCENVEQLGAREQHWIRTIGGGCVNMRIPQRTRQEYYEENKDRLKQQQREYYEANKDRISEYQKTYHNEYYEANKDRLKQQTNAYRETHKDAIKKRKKEYYEENKDRLKEYQKEYREAHKE